MPKPVAEFATGLKKQDQETISSGQRVTIIKTNFFGREKKLQPYLYEKFLFYNECMGMIFYGRKMDFISFPQYVDNITPSVLALELPSDILQLLSLKSSFMYYSL